ncbi:uncharacterized protein [Nothobranchius furzeri]|uniref:uncharacterized protein n=1 Tax=Nothobranchius furzeri TaxID=105023 RepID=UPI00240463B7|nr:uncharacterized protein LOC129152929 [Nothobranchius furzeri]
MVVPASQPAQLNSPVSMTDIYRMSRSVKKSNPRPGNSCPVDTYLSDLQHHFQRCPGMTLEDKIFLIRLTSDAVGSFIDRQRSAIANDYTRLEAANKKEYTYDAKEAGIKLALTVKQGRTEDPQAFYLRLFDAYFGTECKEGKEDEKGFKEIFLENLHPQYSPYMGTGDTNTTPMDELRRMASCAFRRFDKSSKSLHAPSVLVVGASPSSLRLEGTASGTHKNNNCNNGSKQQAQKSNNNSKPKGFPNNKPQNPNRPRTPPPARVGDPKSPQLSHDKHRVSYKEKRVHHIPSGESRVTQARAALLLAEIHRVVLAMTTVLPQGRELILGADLLEEFTPWVPHFLTC